MAWGIPDDLSFTPKQILRFDGGYIVVGVDGHLQKIDTEGKLLGNPARPFPTPIRDAVVIDNTLVATWLDQELLLARMAAISLENDFSDGVNRGDLRVRRTIDKSLHPVGTEWSHVLDAEPLSLAANNNSFSFVLWRRGVYNLSVKATENWRSPEPDWPNLAKIPRAMDTVATTCDDDYFEIWSKGGGMIRYDVNTGTIIEQLTLTLDGYLNQVYKHDNKYLLLYNNSNIALYEEGKIVLNAKLSGPISYAEWSENEEGWHIAGWRELLFVSPTTHNRIALAEIAVFIDAQNGLYLCNDGKWDVIDSGNE